MRGRFGALLDWGAVEHSVAVCRVRSPESVRLSNPAALRPMRLLRIPEPFDHPDWLYEVKFDGFRALAHVNGHVSKERVANGGGRKGAVNRYLIAFVICGMMALLEGRRGYEVNADVVRRSNARLVVGLKTPESSMR